MKYKIPQPAERQRYKAPSIAIELEQAYDYLAMTNPAGFVELVKFDRQQARRNEVYRQRHSRLNAEYDRAVSDKGIEQVDLVTAMPLDNRCKLICTMLLQGYKQTEIACMLHISSARVSQLKAKMGKALKQANELDSQAAKQSDSKAAVRPGSHVAKSARPAEQPSEQGSQAAGHTGERNGRRG